MMKCAYLLVLFAVTPSRAGVITTLDFKIEGENALLVIEGNASMSPTLTQNTEDNQVVIEIPGHKVSKRLRRELDTSSFPGPIALISPFTINGSDTKIVIQLKEAVTATAEDQGKRYVVKIPLGASYSRGEKPVSSELSAPDTPSESTSEASSDSASDSTQAEPPAADTGAKSSLDQYLESHANKRYVGSPITLKFKEAEIADVFEIIHEASGFNIILGDGVTGKMTVSLENVPWDQALDVVLQIKGLGAERTGNVLRILQLGDLAKEKQNQLAAKNAAQAAAPRVTKIFPISYADPKNLMSLLGNFGSKAAGGGGTGVIDLDSRTNSIVVQDTEENLARMKKLIEILDTQIPQILIEAKVVEATEQFSKSLGGNLGIYSDPLKLYFSIAGANPIDTLVGTIGSSTTSSTTSTSTAAAGATGSAIAGASQQGAQFGWSPNLTYLNRNLTRINAILNIAESEQKVKVVSSPRIVVLNRESADITQSTPVLLPVTEETELGKRVTFQVLQAVIGLKAVPTVTNDGGVFMDLTIQRDVPFQFTDSAAVANRNMKTKVLVESGATLVIGGVYTIEKTENSQGFPFLRKLPVIGWLFGQDSSKETKSELFFFITPRILNEGESGISRG